MKEEIMKQFTLSILPYPLIFILFIPIPLLLPNIHTTSTPQRNLTISQHSQRKDITLSLETAKNESGGLLGLLPPGLEPETFALPNTRIEVLVRRSNQLSYGSRPDVIVEEQCGIGELEPIKNKREKEEMKSRLLIIKYPKLMKSLTNA
jgi:hypothetical protein